MGIALQDACSGNNKATNPVAADWSQPLYHWLRHSGFRTLRWPSAW